MLRDAAAEVARESPKPARPRFYETASIRSTRLGSSPRQRLVGGRRVSTALVRPRVNWLAAAQLPRWALQLSTRRGAALPGRNGYARRAALRFSAVAAGDGARDQCGVFVHRHSLIQKGLIWSPRGQLDFAVPLFATFLRGNHPLVSFEEA